MVPELRAPAVGSSRLGRFLSVIGAVAILVLVAGLAAGPDRRRHACVALGLCEEQDVMGAMLLAVQRQKSLLVLSARLIQPVTSARETTVGPLTVAVTRQTAILPATVHYAVDLSSTTAADLQWDESARTLTVRRPPVAPMEPVIAWDKALVYDDGGLVAALTDVSDNLRQDNAEKAPALFASQARSKDLMALADTAADASLRAVFALPLAAAGYPDARVIITARNAS